jgi:hypothetical protein
MFQLLINCSGTSAEVTILVGGFASGTKNSRDMASWFWRAESRCLWVLFFGPQIHPRPVFVSFPRFELLYVIGVSVKSDYSSHH